MDTRKKYLYISMKSAFLSISFTNRKSMQGVIDTLQEVLAEYNFKLLIFVDEYIFKKGEEKEMMKLSCRDIALSDLVIAEVSEKAIGVGVEVGYAIGLNKPVLYLRDVNAEYSSTIGGIVTNQIVYSSETMLKDQLHAILKTF